MLLTCYIPSVIFVVGYVMIICEHFIPKINKSAVAVLMAFLIWFTIIITNNQVVDSVVHYLEHGLSETFQILFFLAGSLTLVEYIDSRNGFNCIVHFLSKQKGRAIIFYISVISFIMSSVLDNMTTGIVMAVLLKRIISEKRQLWFAMSLVLLMVNIGGAFTPIGDITTTMLWIKGLLTAKAIILKLFIPSVSAAIVATLCIYYRIFSGNVHLLVNNSEILKPVSNVPIYTGLASFILVPILKGLFSVPPFLTVIGAVGFVWIIDELLLPDHNEHFGYGMIHKVVKSDLSPILFFYGILLSISGLGYIGALNIVSRTLTNITGNYYAITYIVGVISAFIDNVPIVASMSSMFGKMYSVDHDFWILTAYTAGVGGNLLIIGSSSGIAMLGIENISLMWYIRNITPIAFLSYTVGFIVFFVQSLIFNLIS